MQDREGNEREVSIAGRLLVPIANSNGKMMSLQLIEPSGGKMFMPNSRVEGGHFIIGGVERPGPILVAEGYATAATLHELAGMPAIVAFNARNLLPVAEAFREAQPDRPIYIAGDNYHRREAEGKPNIGRAKAEEAAAAIGGLALLPAFAVRDPASDWNDLAQHQGRDAARQQLMGAIAIAKREQIVRGYAAAPDAEQAHGMTRAPTLTPGGDQTSEVEVER